MPMLEELGYVPKHRYAFGEEIRLHLAGDRRALRPRRRRPVPHRRDAAPSGTRTPARWRIRTDRGDELTQPLLRARRRDPQPAEAAGHPRHGGLRRAVVPHRPLGLRRHRRRARASRSPSSATRSSASSAPAPPASSACRRWPRRPSTSTCSSARRRPSACAATGPPIPTSPTALAAGLAAGPDGQLPGDHARPAGRGGPHRRRVDPPLRRRPPPAPLEGHDARGVHARRRGARLRDHGGAPAPGRGARGRSRPRPRSSSRYYRYLCKRPVLPRRVPERVQQRRTSPSSTAPPASTGSPSRARWSTASSTRSTASSTAPASRPSSRRCTAGPATRSSGASGVSLAEKWADGAATPLRDDDPRLPEPVRHAGAGPAGRRHRQLHAARRARRRVHRRRGRHPRAAGREGVRRERRGRGGAGPRRSSTRSSTAARVMSACTPSRINQEGNPEAAEPPQRQLRPRLRRLLRLPRAAASSGSTSGDCEGLELDDHVATS